MLQTGQRTAFFGLFSERGIHELTNAGFNILSYYVEEEKLPRTVRELRIDFIITDDVQKSHLSFSPKFLVMVR